MLRASYVCEQTYFVEKLQKILLDLLLIDTLPPSGGIYMNETRFSKNCAKNGFLILGKCVEPDFI